MDTMPKTKLTVQTPDGAGTIFERDSFSEREVGVRLASGELVWFLFSAVTPMKEMSDGHDTPRP